MKYIFFIFLFLFNTLSANDLNKTPMEYVYEQKLGSSVTMYHRYAQFFLDSKVSNNKEALQKILSSQDDYLKYYEAIIKGLYNYYLGDKQLAMYQLLKAYDRQYDQIKDSFEGLFVENIFLKEKIYDKLNILTTDSYCETLSKETDRNACFTHMTLKYYFSNDYVSYYILLKKIMAENSQLGQYLIKYVEENKIEDKELADKIAKEISNKEGF